MVICKFFLQGTCKFGDSCKFEHQINDHNYAGSSSILLQNYAPKPQTTSNIDTNTLVKAVVNDMTSAEKGGQWLLSSYAPFKEKPPFPGFEDHSMEEVRYLFYESMKTGSIERYKQNLQMMLQQAMMKIKALQNPSPDAVHMLKSIYDTPPSSSFGNNQQPQFGNTAAASFRGAQTQNFGNTTPNQNIFSGNTMQQNAFTGTNTNSVFGGSQNTQNPVFANTQNRSIFGAQQTQSTNNSIFGPPAQQPQAGNSSIFGGSSLAGTQQSIFGKQQNAPFGQPNQSPFSQQNVFQQNTQNNQFGANNMPQFGSNDVFGGSQQPSNFGPPPASTAQTSVPAFQHSQNIFGNLAMQTPGSVFNSQVSTKPNEGFYSKLEDLTEEEIKWFQSDDLDIMKIPEKPPTYEMCFKS